MKITIRQDEINKGLVLVGRAVANRGQLPILSNVLLEAEAEGLSLSATNLEIGLRVFVGGRVEEPGSICAPAKNLTEFISSIPGQTVTIESVSDKLKITCGKYSGSFSTISASEFPVMPKFIDSGRRVKIERELVEEIASMVAYAAAGDESRPVLTGIQIKDKDEQLQFTATDGFRMSRRLFGGEIKAGTWEGLIIPARTMIELSRIVGEGKKEEIEMEVVRNSNQVLFGYDQIQLVSRLLEGNFPDVEKIIPVSFKGEVIVDREELLQGVRAAAIFARDNNNIVKLKVGEKSIKVWSSATQSGESEAELEGDLNGEEQEVAFNFKYLLDFLASIKEERVCLKLNGPLAPGVFVPEKDKNLIHLIMPVRV